VPANDVVSYRQEATVGTLGAFDPCERDAQFVEKLSTEAFSISLVPDRSLKAIELCLGSNLEPRYQTTAIWIRLEFAAATYRSWDL
jgi:hypothetical protein